MNSVLNNATGPPTPNRLSGDSRAVMVKTSRTIPTLRPMSHPAKSTMTPNHSSRSSTDRPAFNSSRSRLHLTPETSSKRASGGTVSSSACDSSTHSIKSSLTASTTTTTSSNTTNYILLNKLRVQQSKRKAVTLRPDGNSTGGYSTPPRPVVSKINNSMGQNVAAQATRSRPIITRVNAQSFLAANCNKKESMLRDRKVNHSTPVIGLSSAQHGGNCKFSKSSQSAAKISSRPLNTNSHSSSNAELKLLLNDARLAAVATCDEPPSQDSPEVTIISDSPLRITKSISSPPTSDTLSLHTNTESDQVIHNLSFKSPESSSSCDMIISNQVVPDVSQLDKSVFKMVTSPVKSQAKSESKQFDNLLHFIENSSSEFLFLLNKSAKLSYQISIFEQKLDYLEKIFVKQNHPTVKHRTDRDVSQKWAKVIGRTRCWVDKARQNNPFLTKVSLKQRVLRATESKKQLLQHIREMSKEQKKLNQERTTFNQNETNSLSSKDELIVLLDRIAQFSSNIISKCKTESSLSKSSLSQQDSILQDKSDQEDSGSEVSNGIINRLVENSSKNDKKPNINFVKILQPEVVKALVELARTETRLNNVQRELDLMMCAHLKSYGEWLGQSKETVEHEFSGASLPMSFNVKQVNSQLQEVPGLKSNRRHVHTSQHHRSVRTLEHNQTHCCTHGPDALVDSKHSQACNFVSDGDSGGEFTVTTVTNEFSPCAAEDELSSLLNQIALCSQKIIEHSTGTSSNSTSSSGCCCSTSIEAKCSGGCSVGQSRSMHKELSPYNSQQCCREHPNRTTYSISNLPQANYHKPICCTQCSHISGQTTRSNLRSQMTYDNLSQLAESTYLKRNSLSGSHACCHTHPATMSMSVTSMPGHRLSLNHPYDEDYIHASANQMSSRNRFLSANQAKFGKRNRETEWPIKDPFVDCISNNVTGFMLSSSMVDLLGHQHYKRCHYGPEQTYEMVDCPNDNTLNPTSAFIFDPNVDVENFLQEIERELDDNCYTSAPPFMPSYNEDHHGHYRSGSVEHSHRCVQPSTRPYISSCSSHLVTGPVMAGPTASLHSEARNCMSHCSNYISGEGGSIHHSPLAGSNWRLSHRNLIVDGTNGELTSPSNYYPFPATASMPNGYNQSPNQCDQYKRLIGSSSSSDLLDKFRSQVSNRVTQETEQQLREIDQWLHEQLVQCGSIRTEEGEHANGHYE